MSPATIPVDAGWNFIVEDPRGLLRRVRVRGTLTQFSTCTERFRKDSAFVVLDGGVSES